MFISMQGLVRKHGPLILGVILAVSVGLGLLFTPSGSLVGGGNNSAAGCRPLRASPLILPSFKAYATAYSRGSPCRRAANRYVPWRLKTI